MRESDDLANGNNWFSKWEDDLPSPGELMPLSQSLITHDLALAFDISTNLTLRPSPPQPQPPPRPSTHPPPPPPSTASQPDFADSSAEMGSGGDEPARTLKRPRLVWTPQLHKRFVDAVSHLGIKNAVPKTIMQLMSVDGLTRENVASHLQKYRLYLKRMQGNGGSGGGGNGGSGGGGGLSAAGADPATDHLFASSPVPPHFLHPVRPNSDHCLPFVPVAALQHHQMAAVAAHPGMQPPYHRLVGQFGSPPNGQFDHSFLSRPGHPVNRFAATIQNPVQSYAEDLDSASANGGRKVLTLFPAGDD
ncbi:transcription factor MYBC1-like [Punica granatum]|nr:transcription factor MYBC1-like [Punica granatum]XP_031382594.1 transcription factor MYBC1-like [Punica granatum]PKI31943.1 hypothetical protein CRG98_047661 [Punica granatum]